MESFTTSFKYALSHIGDLGWRVGGVKVESITDITLEIQLAINGNVWGSRPQDSNL